VIASVTFSKERLAVMSTPAEGSTQQLVFRKTPEPTDHRSTGVHQSGLIVICLSGRAAVKVDGKDLSLIRTCPRPVIEFCFRWGNGGLSRG
jgi:hypothetical protein